MGRYVRNDDIVFSGNDAVEYMNICDGVYNNDENRIAFQNYMSEHMKTRYDSETGDVYLDCDFVNLDGIDTIMMECDIEPTDSNSEFADSIEKGQTAQISFEYEENVEYIQNDYSDADCEEPYYINSFIIDIEAA